MAIEEARIVQEVSGTAARGVTVNTLDDLTFPALAERLQAEGVGAAHASAVFHAVHRDLAPIESIKTLGPHKSELVAKLPRTRIEVVERHVATDQTCRLLYRFADGATVEGVTIPMRDGPAPKLGEKTQQRTSLCVSTQVGCPVGCAFCATGTLGFQRNLTTGEIIAQIANGRREAQAHDARITHIVFMGMGEPFLNLENVMNALQILQDPHGWSIDSRKVTVSTVGIVPGIERFFEQTHGRIQLAISLHAGTQALREQLIPTAKQYPLETLHQVLKAHPLPGSRYLMIEYIVLPGVNVTTEELEGLASFTRDLRCIVNLIPYNPAPNGQCNMLRPPPEIAKRFRRPTSEELERILALLKQHKVPASIRQSHGTDIAGACGQLARSRAKAQGSAVNAE